MKIKVTIQGTRRSIELTHPGDRPRWAIDGKRPEADAIEISPGIYSVLVDGKSVEVRVERIGTQLRVVANGQEYLAAIENPRELRKNRAGATQIEGRQDVVAPMAGKVIRTLVKSGDEVQSGQGLLIVEAMKMQNEIRSPKAGKVEQLKVVEGQTVNPGDIVVVIA
jgi:biotin carboxyl carrier protein